MFDSIQKYFKQFKVLLMSAVLIGSFASGYYLNDLKWEAIYDKAKAAHSEQLSRINQEYAEQSRKALDHYITLQQAIEVFDHNRTQESNEFQKKLDQLSSDYLSGTKRLSVLVQKTRPGDLSNNKTTNNPSLGDGTETAFLDGRVAEGLTRLTGRGDKAIIQLNACQDILSAITSSDDKALSEALERSQSNSQ